MLTLTQPARPALPLPINRGKTLKNLVLSVDNDAVAWVFHARASGNVTAPIPRGAVLTFQFYDSSGHVLDAPDCGFTYSDALKSRFAYVPVSNKTAAIHLKPVLPPAGAIRLECQLQRWQSPEELRLSVELSAESKEVSLEQLPALEASNSRDVERVAWRLLELHVASRPHLLEIQALAWRIGASRLLAKASHLLDVAPEARGYMRNQARFALAALNDLEDWPADTAPSLPHTGLPHRVAHLAPAQDSPALQLSRAQFERGMRPLVLVPSGYGQPSHAGSPYTVHEEGGVQSVTFNALTPDAARGIPRDDLRRFDVLLAEPWLRRARTGLLHAHVGRSGHDLALRALALAKRCAIPVVMDWHTPHTPFPFPDATSPPPYSEWAEAAYRQQLRCAGRADAVIVADEWQAWQLRTEGIAANRIFVLPQIIATPTPASPAIQDHGNKQWSALLDLRGVDPLSLTALASVLPTAVGRKGVQLHVAGTDDAYRRVEHVLLEAGLGPSLGQHFDAAVPSPATLRASVLIRLRPQIRADQPAWLSDVNSFASVGTLILAESTPESDYLIREAGLGLTFDLTSDSAFAHAFSDLSPSRPVAARLRRSLRILAAAINDPDALAASVDHVYHHALCSVG